MAKYKCTYCEKAFNDTDRIRTADHYIPQSKGGLGHSSGNVIHNVCKVCNELKANYLPSDFIMKLKTLYNKGMPYKGIELTIIELIIRNLEKRIHIELNFIRNKNKTITSVKHTNNQQKLEKEKLEKVKLKKNIKNYLIH